MFMLSFKRSDDIANALDLKLYSEKRTTYKEYDFNYNTGLIVCMHLFLVVICLVVEVFL